MRKQDLKVGESYATRLRDYWALPWVPDEIPERGEYISGHVIETDGTTQRVKLRGRDLRVPWNDRLEMQFQKKVSYDEKKRSTHEYWRERIAALGLEAEILIGPSADRLGEPAFLGLTFTPGQVGKLEEIVKGAVSPVG